MMSCVYEYVRMRFKWLKACGNILQIFFLLSCRMKKISRFCSHAPESMLWTKQDERRQKLRHEREKETINGWKMIETCVTAIELSGGRKEQQRQLCWLKYGFVRAAEKESCFRFCHNLFISDRGNAWGRNKIVRTLRAKCFAKTRLSWSLALHTIDASESYDWIKHLTTFLIIISTLGDCAFY